MEQLNAQDVTIHPLNGLRWKRDLLYFEGPLLSEFTNERNDTYLKYWCDCDNSYNRWMFVKVKEEDRLRLVSGMKSIHEVIKGQQDSFVFLIDEARGNETKTYMCMIDDLPSSYIPEHNTSFLDIEDYVEDENVTSILFDDSWSFDELKKIYHKFTQVYDLMYIINSGITTFNRTLPWFGGANYSYFYRVIKESISHQSKLKAIHYASPGYIKIDVDKEISDKTLLVVRNYIDNKDVVDQLYLHLYNRIKELELNQKKSKEEAIEGFRDDSLCMSYLTNLVSNIEGLDYVWLETFLETDFERAKLIMAHVRRVRDFADFILEREVKVVNPIILAEDEY
ncbi:hypothetical protein [Vibrio parahaemolyticus]|uniref:hypothetical protein n=1 Tax=Vibrio parahaemolyticus TaxID=670 RepID=UPI0011228897|nr:hypothetical protein [Vibrio parahaemolyticus]TNY79158.1 hypothetical protein CGK62_05250 [Vibrio parahaemolyticus]